MLLGYFYSANLARLALYHSDKTIDIILEYTDPVSGQCMVAACEAKAPMITVSPAFPRTSFVLKSWQNNAEVGVCRGDFHEGTLILTERTGVFSGLSAHRLTERETVHVVESADCPGIAPTDMVVLSRKWEGWQLIVGQKGVESWDLEEWDSTGIKKKTWQGRRRITGWSMRYGGGASECSVALVALTSGEHAGKAGWLLWGGDGGLAISGALGDIAGALFLPTIECFPGKISDPKSRSFIGVPPMSITEKLRRSGSNPGSIGVR